MSQMKAYTGFMEPSTTTPITIQESPAPTPPPPHNRRARTIAAVVLIVLVALAALWLVLSHFHALPVSVLPAEPPTTVGTAGVTQIIVTKYPTESVVVAAYIVTESPYNADPTGKIDATAAVQQAMNDAAKNGGGDVYVPAGTYRFDGVLTIPATVTLRGDWKQPTDSDKSVGGTVLAIYNTSKAFISLDGGAGVDSLNFWYPNQTVTNPIKYPATIALDQTQPGWRNLSIQDITFVNSYEMLDTTPNQGSGKGFVVYNVYGTALHLGMVLTDTSSVCRSEEVHFAATYWSSSGLQGAPAYNDIAAYMHANATGIDYVDNWPAYNVSLDDFGTGIVMEGNTRGGVVTGLRIVNLSITGAETGIVVKSGNFTVTGGAISATAGANPVAVTVASGAVNSLLLSDMTLSSTGKVIDDQASDFILNLVHDTFAAWKGYAVSATAGKVILEGSTFAKAQDAGSKHVSLGSGVASAVLLANTYGDGSLAMDSSAPAGNVSVNDAPLSIPALGINGFTSSGISTDYFKQAIPAQPKPARTDTKSLFVVTNYGATADCTDKDFDKNGKMTGNCTDNTVAFQKALDAAGANGGGTVYVPGSPVAQNGGYFFTGHLSVPSGVELTGAPQDASFHTIDTRTALYVQGDKDPFITLAAGAGARGLAFWYTNQNGYAPGAFGYTLQAQGQNDWAINLVLANSTSGLDFGTYNTTGHYIEDVQESSLQNPLYISKSTKGFVGDFQTVGTFWLDINKNANNTSFLAYPQPYGNPPQDANGDGIADTSAGQAASLYKSGAGILLGSATNELILNAYIHAPYYGLRTVDDNGGPSFTLIQYGSETYVGLDIEALDPAGMKVISSQYHTISSSCYPSNCPNDVAGKPYLIVGSAVAPTTPISIYSFANHSPTPVGFDLSGGKTIVQQYFSDQDTSGTFNLVAAAEVHGATTGLALLGGYFINPLTPGTLITDDSSPNVAVAGLITQTPVVVKGPVNVSFQSDVTAGSQSSGKDKSKDKTKDGGKKK